MKWLPPTRIGRCREGLKLERTHIGAAKGDRFWFFLCACADTEEGNDMRSTSIFAVVLAAAMLLVTTSANVADETRSTETDIAVCPKVATTQYPVPPDGPGTFGCGQGVFTGPGDLGEFATSDNPLGVFIHVAATTGEGVSGPVTVTVTSGSRTLNASGTTSMQGTILLPIGAVGPGTYDVTVDFAGSTRETPDGSTFTYEPSQATGTFTLSAGK